MDIDELRRTNIRAIEREFGSPTALANAVGMSYAQYQNTRDGAKEAKTGKKRGMRKETAWRFEDAGGKPRGWLDQQHTNAKGDLAERLATADAATLHLVEMALYENDDDAAAKLTPSLVAMVRALKVMIRDQGGQN